MLRKIAAGLGPALALCALLCQPHAARAQTTDGYHAIQVLPVVVDTASFTQHINFRNPETNAITLSVDYYPADGTAQATPMACSSVNIPGESDAAAPSLLALCPGMAAGSNFGTLVMRTNTSHIFSVYSRVSNAQGAGFSVEAFAAHTFTSAVTAVTGLRRLAASAGSPAYQSNCFVGNLAEFTPAASPPSTGVTVSLQKAGMVLGTTQVSLPPGRLVRLLDVFAAVGLAEGDVDDATALFTPTLGTQPALLAFCTVQDNTSFGADFRIAKTELGIGILPGSQDDGLFRQIRVSGDFRFSGEAASRKFSIPAGETRNVHVYHFRHPDVIGCKLVVASTNLTATPAFGLEMRLLASDNTTGLWQPIAGGTDAVSFANLYLGDKIERGQGFNTRYLLEVESNGLNLGAERLYKLDCSSGSGHGLGEMVLTNAPVVF